MTEKLNESQERFSNKRNILVREDLEYTANKIFWGTTIGLSAIAIYAALAFLVVQQLRK